MENASKALIIAGGVLISVLVLSLAVYLFTVFGGSTKQINDQVTESQISQFNVQFTQYEGQKSIRAYDIVSIANLARQNNEKYDYDNTTEYPSGSSKPYYITVKVNGIGDYSTSHFENQESKTMQDFIKKYSLKSDNITPYYFECTNVNINSDTKYVNSITFALK